MLKIVRHICHVLIPFISLYIVFQTSAHASALHQNATASPIATVSLIDIATPTPTPQAEVVAPSVVVTQTNEADADHPQSESYRVREGDTLWTVALEIGFDLAEMNCVIAPDFTWDQPLVIGDLLQLPPPGTPCHEVEEGETLATIAAQYSVTPQQIVAISWNDLLTATPLLTPGTYLRIPPIMQEEDDSPQMLALLPQLLSQPATSRQPPTIEASRPQAPIPPDWPYGSGDFVWPVYGWISQGYHRTHRAVDLAAPIGTLVAAADRGVVVRSGWNEQGYGLFVIIDHNIDYVTLYSHLSQIYVEEGQVVAQGDIIGRVGSTGNSTGPHLHFEIRDFGQRVDPIPLLLR